MNMKRVNNKAVQKYPGFFIMYIFQVFHAMQMEACLKTHASSELAQGSITFLQKKQNI